MSQIPAIKVLSSFGLKGYTKISSYLSLETLQNVKSFFNTNGIEYVVEDLNTKGTVIKIKFVGIDTPEEVKLLTNQELMIDSENLPALGEDEVYFFDLVNKDVIYQGKVFGSVYSVQNFGAGDVIEIALLNEKGDLGDTVFVPFSKECIEIKDDDKVEISDFCYENYLKQ